VTIIDDKRKCGYYFILYYVLNILFFILINNLPDKTLFNKCLPAWIGVAILYLGIFGLRFKMIFLLKYTLIEYESGSELKTKICNSINIIAISGGISLFVYGIYYFMTYTV